MSDVQQEVSEIIQRARAAQGAIADYTQEQADELATAVGWATCRKDRIEEVARLAYEEGGLGNFDDKLFRTRRRIMGVLSDLRGFRTVGVVEVLPERGLVKIAKPVGVIGAIIPTTAPEAAPVLKTMWALKCRNAIVMAPPRRTPETVKRSAHYMRLACEQVGAPADLVQCLPDPNRKANQELMRQADLVVATGSDALVKAAYSSGTPAYGVGVGNTVHVVDETADLADATRAIVDAKTFDYASSCLADNAVIAEASIYDDLLARLIKAGGYLCNAEDKARVQKAMWPNWPAERPELLVPALEVVAQPAWRIAELAGLTVPPDTRFLMVEEQGAGPDHPFSGEKLSPVLALYRYRGGIQKAVELTDAITSYQGLGHTCGIHTGRDEHVDALALGTKTSRVMVNQNLDEGSGSVRNGLPFTLSLSCGTWGGNITNENVNARHFLNYTWVSRPIKPRMLSEEELFGAHWARHGKE